jgi:hypothetical protein
VAVAALVGDAEIDAEAEAEADGGAVAVTVADGAAACDEPPPQAARPASAVAATMTRAILQAILRAVFEPAIGAILDAVRGPTATLEATRRPPLTRCLAALIANPFASSPPETARGRLRCETW